jgi:hypothetical protein
VGSEDAYVGTLQIAQEGEYDATFRFSLDGTRWVLADRDGSGNGYDPTQAISVLVRPRPVGAPSLEELAPTEGLVVGLEPEALQVRQVVGLGREHLELMPACLRHPPHLQQGIEALVEAAAGTEGLGEQGNDVHGRVCR